MHNIRLLIDFLKMAQALYSKFIPKSILNSVLKSITPFINIFIPKLIIDELLGNKDVTKLMTFVALLVSVNFVIRVINNYMEAILDVERDTMNAKFENYFGQKCVEMDFEHIENPEILDLKERAFHAIFYTGAVDTIIHYVSLFINEAIVLIGLSYILGVLNPLLIVGILIIVVINAKIFRIMEKNKYKSTQEAMADERGFRYFNDLIKDFTIGKDIRLYSGQDLVLGRAVKFRTKILNVYTRQMRMVGKYTGITKINVELQMVIVYGYLTFIAMAKAITIGQFTLYAGAVSSFSKSFSGILECYTNLSEYCNYLELFVKFDQIESKNTLGKLEAKNMKDTTIQFENVSFKYPGKTDYVLKDVSITIKPGEKLSVVGLNGAGKTTFIKLLARLYEPTSGTIYIGNKNISDYNYEEYMSLLAIVFQDFQLLSYTIKENLSHTCEEDELIHESLNKAGLEEDLKILPKGIHTNIYKSFDKEGIEFSGGQAQKIAIGRALHKDSPVVILDEPTSALDPISEYEIYNSFNNLVDGKTAIYISHRLSSTRFSDNIAVFKDGEIIEYGHHNELVNDEETLYSEMYQTQAQYYIA